MKAKALFLIALLSLATPSCGILKMFKKSSGDSEEIKSSEKVTTEEQKLKNYLDTEGEGEFHDVLVREYQGDDSVVDVSFGYKGNTFLIGLTQYSLTGNNLVSTFAAGMLYNQRIFTGTFLMTQSKTTLLDVDLGITTSNHYMTEVEITKVNTNEFSSGAADSLADLIAGSAQLCIRDVSDFLKSESLPYIY